ncbi:CCR4-NOT transcription complex subunit 10-like isoform X2 [Glycine soja]|uniref:CCR4-NOT transcription complex subunit 10 n=1 Tax=Glycine soja TaxID=3848 RepID=A0A0B2P7F1_GLYSO|nr:CCR4-NOT transcription complex subunit 10-like isoform X2 [Glycine soja]KHN03608.1 CCR4-NOT transcription complex subunit 10 [Glycine soja]RZB81313.1 CCR4-NOT transcription complex subunit 10 isoform A [Glycine soja]RZB81314.1 CCR4-NOT transcription complex subunit 10 isoform B [Glycine soja]RZB81315.1 CCR4-NOT transcription complex subunit 10 isoform C [Glycine soja]
MESRDLPSSSPSSTTNRDASFATDAEDGVFTVVVALAKDAALHFQSGKFAECVEVLNQLLQKKQDDPKVLHNIAIAEFFRDGCSDPKKLLQVINGIKRKNDELALVLEEQGESVNNVGNKVLGSKGSNASAHQFSGANSTSTSTMYTDEFDSSVAMLNIAIIWFHLHDYAKTLSVLEPLFQNIEPIDETTALHICLLLLDASLACHDASKSADVLTYLEKAFGVSSVSQGDSGNTAQQQAANLITKSVPVASNVSAADASSSDLGPSANVSENHLSRDLSEDTLDYEAMILDMGGQNLARPMGPSSNDLSRALVDRFSTVDLKLKLQLYKVRFLLLTRNLKLAKREVKLAMNIARGRDSSMALLLKSQLEYARGNHRKAVKLLMASNNRTDTAFSSIFNNNLGCIYYQLGKYQTSSLFFSKALTNCSSLRKDQSLKLATFSQDNSLLIIYNCGVQYLACGKPILAARCFQKASLVFYKQPLLWLRLSECCLMALEKGLIKSSRVPSEKLGVGVCVVGIGKWRQLVVEDQISGNGLVDSSEGDDCPSEDGRLKLSMSLARQCLLNALHLLDSNSANCLKSGLPSNSSVEDNNGSEVSPSKNSNIKNSHGIDSKAFSVAVGLGQVNANGDTKEQKGVNSQELVQNSLSCYENVRNRENQLVKQAVLANLAYVELELDNPVKALSVAKSLLELPECSRIYIFLGHVYAAEALCLMNRPKEAAEHLSFYLSGGNNVDLPFSLEDCEKWQPERTADFEEVNGGSTAAKNSSLEGTQSIVFLKPEEARATIYANFAVMSAMQGEFEKSNILVAQALSLLPNSPEATLTAVYVDLLLGKPQEALTKLKRCSRIRFLPSGITLNKSS